MIHILLACESGSGIGHIDSLKMFARALGPRFHFDGVHFNDDARAFLAEVCDETFAGPASIPRPVSPNSGITAQNWSWATFLQRCGMGNVTAMAQSINWWRLTFAMRETDLVVCDYAPYAMIAAHMLGIPVVLTGTAYSVPPNGLKRFFPFLEPDGLSPTNEAEMVQALNNFGGIRGLRHITYLPEIFDCAVKLPQGVGFLDPYQKVRTEPLLPRPFTFSSALGGEGKEIFVYFSNVIADPDYLLAALPQLGLPVRAFIPWLPQEKAALLRQGGVTLEEKLVDPNDIARRTRLMLLYGQPGSMIMGLAAGIPQLALPQHLEQRVHAERAERKGGVRMLLRDGLNQERFIAEVKAAYHDQQLFDAAQRLAPELRREITFDVSEMIRETLRPTLVEIIKRKGLA